MQRKKDLASLDNKSKDARLFSFKKMSKLTPRQKRLIREKVKISNTRLSKIDKLLKSFDTKEVIKSYLKIEKETLLRKINK